MIVSNTSPLIALACIDQLSCLEQIFNSWVVPPAVFKEATRDKKPFSRLIEKEAGGKIKNPKNQDLVESLTLTIDQGEAEVVVLAEKLDIKRVLMDDKKGRRIAKERGLNPIGTLGVLIKSKNKGEIKAVKPLLDRLIENGIRISEDLYLEALKLADEQK
jgi:hypothetical protein